MPTHQTTLLSDRGVLLISGSDAAAFLQNIITSDLDNVTAGQAIYSALLTPQGKILFDFFLIPAGEAFLIDAPASEIPALLKRLAMYRLRSDVEIADVSKAFVIEATWAGMRPTQDLEPILYQDPRHRDLGQRAIVTRAQQEAGETDGAKEDPNLIFNATLQAYDAHRIDLGIPQGGKDFKFGDVFPHDALLDQLHGVSFAKGCYVGQEVVSRMHHRATARKRIIRVVAANNASLPEAGTEITAGAAKIGKLGSSHASSGLALVRLDRAKEAIEAGTPIQAGDVVLDIHIPDWANFSLDNVSGKNANESAPL
ncbi:MAG: YgfZ/GcvT domain-containing protein [Hyphomicrobiaceae bacterium]